MPRRNKETVDSDVESSSSDTEEYDYVDMDQEDTLEVSKSPSNSPLVHASKISSRSKTNARRRVMRTRKSTPVYRSVKRQRHFVSRTRCERIQRYKVVIVTCEDPTLRREYQLACKEIGLFQYNFYEVFKAVPQNTIIRPKVFQDGDRQFVARLQDFIVNYYGNLTLWNMMWEYVRSRNVRQSALFVTGVPPHLYHALHPFLDRGVSWIHDNNSVSQGLFVTKNYNVKAMVAQALNNSPHISDSD